MIVALTCIITARVVRISLHFQYAYMTTTLIFIDSIVKVMTYPNTKSALFQTVSRKPNYFKHKRDDELYDAHILIFITINVIQCFYEEKKTCIHWYNGCVPLTVKYKLSHTYIVTLLYFSSLSEIKSGKYISGFFFSQTKTVMLFIMYICFTVRLRVFLFFINCITNLPGEMQNTNLWTNRWRPMYPH